MNGPIATVAAERTSQLLPNHGLRSLAKNQSQRSDLYKAMPHPSYGRVFLHRDSTTYLFFPDEQKKLSREKPIRSEIQHSN
jgi:hypothetical protein